MHNNHENYCSQEAAYITPNEFLVFGRHVQCLKLNIIYRIIKFRTFEHFLKYLPYAKSNPKYRTCPEFSGRHGNPTQAKLNFLFHISRYLRDNI